VRAHLALQVISIKAAGKRVASPKKRGYADDFVPDLNACIYCGQLRSARRTPS
jgi:hypothetical protein